jgi:ribose 1,5-bisphosphokinase
MLFDVVGPSGAGKDSLIAFARGALGGEESTLFAHRYITRPASAGGESHVALTNSEFSRMQRLGLFTLDGRAIGLRYGVGVEVRFWLERGANVVLNGSRAYLPIARQRVPRLTPVVIDVSPETLRGRLENRGRESVREIEDRVARAGRFVVVDPDAVHIENNGPLEDAADRFVRLLRDARVG